MKNKKGLMCFASILILIFHLWTIIFDRQSALGQTEQFLRSICYIGVDLFFLLSAYHISTRPIENYFSFFFGRFVKLYPLFFVFTIIMSLKGNKDLSYFLLTASGLQLFIKGGGSFLWFIPAILFMYLLLPLYASFEKKHSLLAPCSVGLVWLGLFFAFELVFDYSAIYIIWNRIPIILIGYYLGSRHIGEARKASAGKDHTLTGRPVAFYIASTALLIFGFVLIRLTYQSRYAIPDVQYLICIPFVLGITGIAHNWKSNKVIDFLGSITLELYALQMLIGYQIAGMVATSSRLANNLITVAIMLCLSAILSVALNYLHALLLQR